MPERERPLARRGSGFAYRLHDASVCYLVFCTLPPARGPLFEKGLTLFSKTPAFLFLLCGLVPGAIPAAADIVTTTSITTATAPSALKSSQPLSRGGGGRAAARGAPMTLVEALALAEKNNEIGGIAEARIAQGEALLREAYGSLLPRVGVSATYSRGTRGAQTVGDGTTVLQTQTRDGLIGTGSVDMILFNAPAIPLVRSARRSVDATRLNAEDLRRALAFNVATAYFAVLSAETFEQAAFQRLDFAHATVAETTRRFGAGLASRNDVTRSELELATARFVQKEAENAVVKTRLALGFLMATEADRPLAPSIIPALDDVSNGKLVSAAHELRPDLRAQEELVEAARLRKQAPWLSLLPSLSVGGVYRALPGSGGDFRQTDWTVATTLSWILYDGGIRYARAAAYEAQFREVSLQTNTLRRQVAYDVRAAMADLETAEAALFQSRERSRVAAQNAEEVKARFAAGLATALEQADANASQFEADAEIARQDFSLRSAQLDLLRALGRWPAVQADDAPQTERQPASSPQDAPEESR
jgi:outer membrane protein TolC